MDIDDEKSSKKKNNKSAKSSKSKGGTTTTTPTTHQQTQTKDDEDTEAKLAINTAMKDSDTAHTLGEAIRARAHILRKDKLPFHERTFDSALVSLGLSLGTAGLDVDEDEIITSSSSGEEDLSADKKVQDTKKSAMMAYYQYGHCHEQQNQQFVQPSTSAVIANYFLKTHGGTHLIQCVLSLLASVLGMLCLVLPPFPSSSTIGTTTTNSSPSSTTTKVIVISSSAALSKRILHSTMKYQLLQQTLLVAMAKHISAIAGAVILGAQRIPTLGIRSARRYLEMVALDPVGQYLFYCSILVVWLGWFGGGGGGNGTSSDFMMGLRRSVSSIQNTASAAAAAAKTTENANQEVETISQLLDVLSQSSPPWFLSQSHGGTIVPIIMLTPILLREVISIIWVVSDVLSLALTSSSSGDSIMGKFCQGILSTARSILDTFMSVVISSDQWTTADSFQRQRTLARLVSQTSLVLEVIVGAVLFCDAIQAFWGFSFGSSGGGGAVVGARLPLKIVVGKMVCAHLYINFLLSRRRKIHALIGSIRSSRSNE